MSFQTDSQIQFSHHTMGPLRPAKASASAYAISLRQYRGAQLKNFKQGRVGFPVDQTQLTWKYFLNAFAEFQNDEHFFSKVLPCENSKLLMQLLLKEELDLILLSENSFKELCSTWPMVTAKITIISKAV